MNFYDFRAWSPKWGCMVYQGEVVFEGSSATCNIDVVANTAWVDLVCDQDITPLVHIGRRDHNGTKIYQGDKIYSVSQGIREDYLGIVEYCPEQCAFGVFNDSKKDGWHWFKSLGSRDIEVYGHRFV